MDGEMETKINEVPLEEKKVKVKQENENSDESSDRAKKEAGELNFSLPLSLEMSNVNVKINENVSEQMHENSNLHNLSNYNHENSYKGPSGNLFDPISGLSPFMSSNVHNLSFNNDQYKGRNLFSSNKRNTNQSQFSQMSPLTSIKIPNSSSIHKTLNEIDGMYQNYYQYHDHDLHYPFNSRGSFKQHSPIYSKRVLNFNKQESMTGMRNILNYINHENVKEMRDKENVNIKICKNEKLIKTFFEIKDEIFSSSEENSRKFGAASMHNSNVTSNQFSNQDENSQKSKYRIDYGNLLNNTTRTIRNLNLDFKINFTEGAENINYNMINYLNNYSNLNNYNINYRNYPQHLTTRYPTNIHNIHDKPLITRNFLKEEKIRHSNSFSFRKDSDGSNKKSNISNAVDNSKPKTQCNCKKSKCLKLYCECFANEGFCTNCNCVDCHNVESFSREREEAIALIKEKNPSAFVSKVAELNNNLKHTRGCNCTKSNCMKKYCECYQKGIGCSEICRCRDCKNKKEKEKEKDKENVNLVRTIKEDIYVIPSITENAHRTRQTVKKFEYQIENTSICLNSDRGDLMNSISSNIKQNQSKSTSRSKEPAIIIKEDKKQVLQLTNKKRKRGSKKIRNSKSLSKSKSQNKSDKKNHNIVALFTRANDQNSINNTNSNLTIQSNILPMTTPKKQTRYSSNLSSNQKFTELSKVSNSALSRRHYKDTTISTMISTTQTSTKRRTETKVNKNDTIVRRLDKELVNVNNEPLFGSKSKSKVNK